MKTMIYSLTLAALMITSFSSCSDDNDPVLTSEGLGRNHHLFCFGRCHEV